MERKETKEQNKIYSSVICFLLDNLGYNDDIRRFRETLYERTSYLTGVIIASNLIFSGGLSVRAIATGSKFEGASLPLQGDIDTMIILEDILCTEESSGITNFNTLKTVYSENVPPGYVRVAKVHLDNTTFMGSLCSNSYLHLTPDGQPYISSTVFHNFCKQSFARSPLTLYQTFETSEQLSYSGPACTRTLQSKLVPCLIFCYDTVLSIYFYSSKYMPRWAARTRQHCYLSSDVIKEISSTEGYIVPVGSIEGENPDLEWRISYVTAENKLISNLNTIQFKLYIIMKMIAKEIIYPDFPVISSYVVKNIVLWVRELNPQSLFTADLLLDQIRKCLSFMRTCLQNNHLPNYIIPERNLIAFRVNVLSKRQLILRISNLVNDGRDIFSRLSIFKKHSPLAFELVLAPSSVYFFGKTRDKVEKLLLLLLSLQLKLSNIRLDDFTRSSFRNDSTCGQDERYLHLLLDILSLVLPEAFTILSSCDNKQILDMFCSRLQFYL